MNYYLLILRILHIGAGVYWVGSTLLLAFVITPALKATGASGQKFVDYLITKKRFGTESAGAGSMSGIAGILLYWYDSQGLTSAWMHGNSGIGFTVGAVFGLIAFIFGVLTDRKLKAMANLREQFGDSPSEEQTSQLQSLDKQLSTNLYICAGALSLSLWIMAVARYLVF
jgi:uncharacterized membrane protein